MKQHRIYTMDLETDPFKKDRKPEPFCAGLYDGESFRWTWGNDCVDAMVKIVRHLPPGIIYLHNGGKFDIFYMLHLLDQDKEMLIIKERITQAFLKCDKGYHKVRDSLKILPFALREYRKDDIDYWKLEADVRETHKFEILDYLKGDCVYLHKLCVRYFEQFGPAVTIGSTAMKELKKFHDVGEMFTADQDAMIRNRYFFGARVERYKTGVFSGDWKVYDVNSMYPFVMSNYEHPIGAPISVSNEITDLTHFITCTGFSRGAFPVRTQSGVSFPHEHNTFSVTIHEYKAAADLGLFDCDEVLECVDFARSSTFAEYVFNWYGARKQARLDLAAHLKECGSCDKDVDKWCDVADDLLIKILFYKFLLNNSYGRFAMNPENFKDYRITDDGVDLRWHGFQVAETLPEHDLLIWSKATDEFKYMNIGIGASITGAARSVLLRGLHKAVEPMYCDTDSIICKELLDVPVDDADLGAWKLEKKGSMLAIAGRKLYSLFNESDTVTDCVKFACKGVRISPFQIRRIAMGDTVTYERESPTYRLSGAVEFLTRKVRTT